MSNNRSRQKNKACSTVEPHNQSLALAIQEAFSQKPTKVEGQLNETTIYYSWVLLNKLKGLVEVQCPEDWDKDYLLDELFIRGKFCITDSTAGVLPFGCQPFGVNYTNRFTNVNIAVPVLGSFDRTIGVDCTLIYLFDDQKFMSFEPTIRKFAQRLANCDSAIDVNLMNTKVAAIFDCVDKKQADEAKLIYDKISSGEPAVFYHSTSGMNISDKMQFWHADVKNTYVADMVQAEKRQIYNEFLTQVGINNAAHEKKERLLVDEVNSNNEELQINIKYAVENLKQQIEKANKMFPEINFNIKFPFYERMVKQSEEALKNELNRHDADMGIQEQQSKSDGDADNNS